MVIADARGNYLESNQPTVDAIAGGKKGKHASRRDATGKLKLACEIHKSMKDRPCC